MLDSADICPELPAAHDVNAETTQVLDEKLADARSAASVCRAARFACGYPLYVSQREGARLLSVDVRETILLSQRGRHQHLSRLTHDVRVGG